MSGPAREATDPVERLGYLACALLLGFLIGWAVGFYQTQRFAPDCIERAS